MNIPNSFKKIFFYKQSLKALLKTLFSRFAYRMHPETALRYLPIVDLLKEKGLLNASLLEVGSGSYGIAPYLKKEVVGVDTDFNEPEYPLLKQVKGTATKLPFKDSQFEVVILSDVLEHLPSSIRQQSIKEAVRVASRYIIISGPFGQEAAQQDQELANYSLKKLGQMHPFFEDHLRNGLPEVTKTVEDIRKISKVKKVTVVGEYLNLSARKWLMKVFISKNKLQFYFYLKGMMFLVPLLRLMNQKPCYRTVILVEIK